MGQETSKILVVDDDMRLRSLLERYLVEQALAALRKVGEGGERAGLCHDVGLLKLHAGTLGESEA